MKEQFYSVLALMVCSIGSASAVALPDNVVPEPDVLSMVGLALAVMVAVSKKR